MGLNCSHGAFDGSCSYFGRWRRYLAEVAGLLPLNLMEGYYHSLDNTDSFPLPTLYHNDKDNIWRVILLDKSLPIQWDCLNYTPLFILLKHSDCDGNIHVRNCLRLKCALENLLPHMDDKEWINVTEKFIDGLTNAYENNEPLEFN